MLYRLFTEDKDREKIVKLVSEQTDSFTLIPAIGYWQGQPENSLIIELDGVTQVCAYHIAENIRAVNSQQAVMVQELAPRTRLITGGVLSHV